MKNKNEFDLLEGIKKISEVENPYRRFFLSGNPFPKSAVADSTSESFFSRCRKDALEKVKNFLIYAYTHQKWAGLILKGEYGSGKSHTLFFIMNEINRQLGTLENDRALAIYVENPKESINDLYEDVMDKLGRDNFESQVAQVFEKKVQEGFKSLPRQRYLTTTKEEAPQDPLSRLRQMGKSLSQDQKIKAWDRLSKEILSTGLIQHGDFARCLSILTCDDDQDMRNAAWRFSIGKALSKGEARKLGLVSEKLSEDEIIRYVFPSVIRILNKNGIAILILLIDEFEKIASGSRSYTFSSLENLRSLIDNNLDHLSMIFAVVSEAWEVLSATSPGLTERMSEIVDLAPLDGSAATLLVADYLENARIQPYSRSNLLPFDDATIKEINRFSKGSIRYILQNCHIILEYAAPNSEIKDKIPREFVTNILGGPS